MSTRQKESPVKTSAQQLQALNTPMQVSAHLGVPLTTLAHWRYENRGPAFTKLGKLVRYPSEAVEAFVAANMTTTAAFT
ncbi:helix-turn-helix transcriptional regulator [Rathayibacter soli]|uniref:helix-turn-helix transcriptional regulator n=1 Tax=Rathayibacter soli TaxID=3144168 RepID=UPI0027E447FE|nr:helix-turn-helix domain-containing protein [Glaciibacter superstes]